MEEGREGGQVWAGGRGSAVAGAGRPRQQAGGLNGNGNDAREECCTHTGQAGQSGILERDRQREQAVGAIKQRPNGRGIKL